MLRNYARVRATHQGTQSRIVAHVGETSPSNAIYVYIHPYTNFKHALVEVLSHAYKHIFNLQYKLKPVDWLSWKPVNWAQTLKCI